MPKFKYNLEEWYSKNFELKSRFTDVDVCQNGDWDFTVYADCGSERFTMTEDELIDILDKLGLKLVQK